MSNREEAQLKVLQILADQPDLSQRDLAERLEVSVGKVNYLLRGLMEVGAIKARNFANSRNKIAYAYLLTPRGFAQKLTLTKGYLVRRQAEYEALRDEIALLQQQVDEASGGMPGASQIR